jgi:hypothetical protein
VGELSKVIALGRNVDASLVGFDQGDKSRPLERMDAQGCVHPDGIPFGTSDAGRALPLIAVVIRAAVALLGLKNRPAISSSLGEFIDRERLLFAAGLWP